MSRPRKILFTVGALAAMLAGLYVASPYLVQLSMESGCSLTKPDPTCVRRMRYMGDAWSFRRRRLASRGTHQAARGAPRGAPLLHQSWPCP